MGRRTHSFRVRPVVALLAYIGLLPFAATTSAATAQAHASARTPSRRTTIELGNTLVGSLITDTRGYVLFVFPKERRSNAFCRKVKTCVTDWPPLTTVGKPIAGNGLEPSLLGTIPYKGSLREVTYAGHPLHLYKFAYSAQSSAINIGIKQFGGPWEALTATGKLIK